MGFKCIRQTDLISCGATCIQMIGNFYGKEIPLEVIKDSIGLTNIGASVRDIYEGLKKKKVRSYSLFQPRDLMT